MLEQHIDVLRYVTLAALIALALGALAIAYILFHLLAQVRRIANPSPDVQVARLVAQDRANRLLLETEDGRNALLQLLISEAAIMDYLEEIESHLRKAPNLDIALAVVEEIPKQKKNSIARAWEAVKRNKGVIVEKVFDKANDLVKTFIPGTDKK